MMHIWLNGHFLDQKNSKISIEDSGFTTGIGVFDTQLAVDGKLVYPQEHFGRVFHDTDIVIRKTPDYSVDDLIGIARELLQKNDLMTGRARIRTTITGGVVPRPLSPAEQPSILMSVGSAPDPDSLPPIKAVIIENYPRVAGCVLENCKRLDYSRSYAARRDAEKLGGNEAIVTNTDGNIACATTSNVFIVEDGMWVTPPLSDGVLVGVTRMKVIKEHSAKEENISVERLLAADQVFLTNSMSGVREVHSLKAKK